MLEEEKVTGWKEAYEEYGLKKVMGEEPDIKKQGFWGWVTSAHLWGGHGCDRQGFLPSCFTVEGMISPIPLTTMCVSSDVSNDFNEMKPNFTYFIVSDDWDLDISLHLQNLVD